MPDELFDLPDDRHHRRHRPTAGRSTPSSGATGRPLVLLHGITLRADVWAPQFHQLADRYRVIAVDLRGHGESAAGADGLGIGRLGDDLATVLTALDLRDAIVVGHSMGGMTLMQFCGAHPDVLAERVAGLVFMATRAHQAWSRRTSAGRRPGRRARQAVVDAGRPLPRPPGPARASCAWRSATGPPARAMAIVAEMVEAMDDSALLPSAAGCSTTTPASRCGPRHAVARDRRLPRPAHAGPLGPHLAGLLPDTRLVLLPRAGHQLMQERPDEVARAIDDLVARSSARRRGAPAQA